MRTNSNGAWYVLHIFLILSVFALAASAGRPAQAQEDELRRIWNKKFLEARRQNAHAARRPPRTRAGVDKTANASVIREGSNPAALSAESLDGNLVGVTLWRMAETPQKAGKDQARIMQQQRNGAVDHLFGERVIADTVFATRERVRIGIEVPRKQDGYLYILDREVYVDGAMSAPFLIFPSQSTPPGGNRVIAGKVVYVPAQGDPLPYFNIERSRGDQVSELLTILIAPAPLDVQPGPPNAPAELDRALVAQWEQQWGGRTERRELQGGAGIAWTTREKEAGEGRRKLLQGDLLPQTIYFVAGRHGDHTLVQVPLRIAP